MYLLDTNVLSETRRPECTDPRVRDWFARVTDDWWVSVVTDYELEFGFVGLRHRDPRQASLLQARLVRTRSNYESRLLPITHEIGRVCAQIQVPDRRPYTDAVIAATALHHGLTVVTRNVRDFDVPGLSVFNPFSG